MERDQDLLNITAFFAVLVHVIIILGVTFKLPDMKASDFIDNTLDIVLLNKFNDETPSDATLISSNNNLGGGNDSVDATAAAIPAKPTNPSPVESIKRQAKKVTKAAIEQKKLLTGSDSPSKITQAKPEKIKKINEPQKTDTVTTQSQRQQEIESLRATLDKRWRDYNKRPRQVYLSPTTKINSASAYLDKWIKKIELIGNTEYKNQTKIMSLSGSVMVNVAINKDGSISSIRVLEPSEYKILNDEAVRFIRAAAPFAAFPSELNKTSDIINITRTYFFVANSGVHTTDAAKQ